MPPIVLGLDLGTTYFKVGAFDEGGGLKGLGRVRVTPVTRPGGMVELPVDAFWRLLRSAVEEAVAQAGCGAGAIAGISYASQANTFLLLDCHGTPLTPLVSWSDTRQPEVPAALAAFSASDAFAAQVGFRGLALESAVAKFDWFRTHAPDCWAAADAILTLSDYLVVALTDQRAGDASTASLLGYYHLHQRQWWPDALDVFGLKARQLATPLLPGSAIGRTVRHARELLGVPAGVPFAVGALDHHAAAIGSGVGAFADASTSTGTVLAAVGLVDAVQPAANCFHGPHCDARRFYRLAFSPRGTGQLDRFQQQFAPDQSMDALIDAAAAGADGVREFRRLLEEMALEQRALTALVAGGRVPKRVAATGGATRSSGWLKILAEVLDARILTSTGSERASLGAAVFAAAAAGLHPTVAAAASAMVRPAGEIVPDAARARSPRPM